MCAIYLHRLVPFGTLLRIFLAVLQYVEGFGRVEPIPHQIQHSFT